MPRATGARIRRPSGSTRCPKRLRPGSECPRCRPDVPGHSRLGQRPCGVDQLSRATWAKVRVPTGSTTCPWRLGPVSEGLQCQQLSRATRAWDRFFARSTSSPLRLRPGSEGPRFPPAVRGESRLSPISRGVYQLSPVTRAQVEVPLFPREVDQLSGAIRARAQGPAVSTSHPGRIRSRCKGRRGRPAVPGDSGPCPKARVFDQHSQAHHARVRLPAWSTSSPG